MRNGPVLMRIGRNSQQNTLGHARQTAVSQQKTLDSHHNRGFSYQNFLMMRIVASLSHQNNSGSQQKTRGRMRIGRVLLRIAGRQRLNARFSHQEDRRLSYSPSAPALPMRHSFQVSLTVAKAGERLPNEQNASIGQPASQEVPVRR
jgi:hypothetical protein